MPRSGNGIEPGVSTLNPRSESPNGCALKGRRLAALSRPSMKGLRAGSGFAVLLRMRAVCVFGLTALR